MHPPPRLARSLTPLFLLLPLPVVCAALLAPGAGPARWLVLGFGAAIAFGCAPLLARHVVRGLRRDLAATIAFARWARGHGKQEPALHAHSAELQQLMQAVAAMAATLQNHRAQLDLLNREAEQANADLEEKGRKLAAALARTQELSQQLLGTQERERKHLARELHDELGQRLTALSFMLHSLRPHLAEDKPRRLCVNALAELAQLVADVRRMSASLRPPALDLVSLERAIGQLLGRMFDGGAIALTYEPAGLPAHLPEAVEMAAYRLVQESVTNIVRHADARSVIVEMSCQEGEIEIVVRDDGRGFDPARAARGFGLAGMAERARLLGGELHIASRPGEGTRVHAVLPIQPTQHETPT